MKVSEVMSGITPNPSFKGFAVNDNWVLAVGINDAATENDYIVAQMGLEGVDAQLDAITQDKQYIRAGQSTTKTGTQRNFSISGDRYHGDEFQDYCFSLKVAYGVGQAVVVPYVYFSMLTGKGEKGTASIIVNSDGGGNAGENSTISIDVKTIGQIPSEYTYSAGV